MTAKATKPETISEEEVRAFLKRHPEFIQNNSDLVTDMAPPERNLGDGVLDFQHFMVKNLQNSSKDLKGKYELLIEFCRDNMSAQQQVHNAALKLIRTRGIEQLLEVIALDLVNLFDVDVVRLAMESDIAYETAYGEADYSGIVFIPPGTIDAAIGVKKHVLLVEDTEKTMPPGFTEIFADCEEMIASCALLRLKLDTLDRHILLAFGVRHAGRFHPGQGIELLHFLAEIVAHQLDRYLDDLTG